MVVVLERSAATHCDEPRIPDLGEDHQVQAPVRVNVTCVTPLGEEMVSIS
jgi:hypothetical protein